MYSIFVLPLYVSTLLKRILEARARTERALKECLARQQADVA